MAFALVVFGVAAPGQAVASNLFDGSDGRARWQQSTITVDTSRLEAAGVDVDYALAQWGGPLTLVKVAAGAPADIVMWRTTFAVPGIAGRATPTLDKSQHVITSCKVEIDATRPVDGFTPVEVAHELGHCLGLSHSDEHGPASIMTPRVESPSFALQATPADHAALRSLYR